jgi:hypothetical protein
MTDTERITALEEETRKLRRLIEFLRPSGDAPCKWWNADLEPSAELKDNP